MINRMTGGQLSRLAMTGRSARADSFYITAQVAFAASERIGFDISRSLSVSQGGRVDVQPLQYLFAGSIFLSGGKGFSGREIPGHLFE